MASNALEIIGRIPRGRPRWDYDDAIGQEICERLSDGESLKSICRDADMPSRTTVYEWLEQSEIFADRYARAKLLQADSFADDLHEVARDLSILPEHKRILVDAMKWRAARQNALLWGDRKVHDHTVKLRPAAGADQLPEGIGFLRGFLHGGDASTGPGPDPSGVGEE